MLHADDHDRPSVAFVIGPWHLASYNPPLGDETAQERERREWRDRLCDAGLPFADLTEAFAREFAVRGVRFDFPTDRHLNERGELIKARALAGWLIGEERAGAEGDAAAVRRLSPWETRYATGDHR